MLALHRRDVILEAIARSAEELLRADELERAVPPVLERIGIASQATRVHLLTVDAEGPPIERKVIAHQFWSATGLATPPDFADGVGQKLADAGLASWPDRLARGETISGNTRSFDPAVRRFLESGGVQSTVAVPVFATGAWRGFIAFDQCHGEREWLAAEIDMLKILAELIGAMMTRAERRQSLVDAKRIIENSPTVLYRLAPRMPHPLVFISENIRRYGYEAGTLLATPDRWTDLIEVEDLPGIMANVAAMTEGAAERTRQEFRFRRADGGLVWFEGEGLALRDEAGGLTAIEGILTDITERKQANETLAALARMDSLTGLPNRAAFVERLQYVFARTRRGASGFAVLYLDLDRFKDINDTMGHPAGDTLLQRVADRLKGCLRGTDIVARFGGDEFAILEEDVDGIGDVETLAAKIVREMAEPITIAGNELRISASVGVVPYRQDIEDPEAMMSKADLALYRAKGDGRDCYRFHASELDQAVRERVTIAQDLREAVTRKQFELFYQPQLDLKSGRVVGVEALIRWHHPHRGLVMPDAFIRVAESDGAILAIGQWVIEEACRQMRAWRDQAIAPPVMAVNVSAAQFQHANGLDEPVLAALKAAGLEAGALELELTESVFMESGGRHAAALERLRQAGVRLAIDDFGTGFSSLGYLRTFRVSRLKIAQNFVNGVPESTDDTAIVRAIIFLANALGIETVAEGVAGTAQRAFLAEAGCRTAQGNVLGAAMPAEDMSAFLRRSAQPL
jgi:diguanylate cyclase (GGDEF)-like protein/PAS domain S-box-containing protein